jgi:hypothetical protein
MLILNSVSGLLEIDCFSCKAKYSSGNAVVIVFLFGLQGQI